MHLIARNLNFSFVVAFFCFSFFFLLSSVLMKKTTCQLATTSLLSLSIDCFVCVSVVPCFPFVRNENKNKKIHNNLIESLSLMAMRAISFCKSARQMYWPRRSNTISLCLCVCLSLYVCVCVWIICVECQFLFEEIVCIRRTTICSSFHKEFIFDHIFSRTLFHSVSFSFEIILFFLFFFAHSRDFDFQCGTHSSHISSNSLVNALLCKPLSDS